MMTPYAIVQVGAHQYRVEENTVFDVQRFDLTDNKEVRLDKVLFVQNDDSAQVGQPFVQNTTVVCDAIGEIKQPKVISFKFKKRKGYRKKIGHRQRVVRLKVKAIQTG
jgi:large subunit ribosomal protein L21